MAETTLSKRYGYTVSLTIGRNSNFVVPPSVLLMLLHLLARANLQEDTYLFRVNSVGGFVKATSHLHMHFGAHPSEGWLVKIKFGSAERDTIAGVLQLPKGMTKEFLTPKIKRILGGLNESGWQAFLKPANKLEARKPKLTIVPTSPVIQSEVVLPSTTERQLEAPLLPAETNVTVDLERIAVIRLRTKQMSIELQGYKTELDTIECSVTEKGLSRLTHVEDRLFELAVEAGVIEAELRAYRKVMRGMSKKQLIDLIVG